MQNNVLGITLIELVIVIVSLSILSVIAIPKFIELASSSNTIVAKRCAKALTAASKKNYLMYKEKSSDVVSVHDCKDVSKISSDRLPSGYSIMPGLIQDSEVATCVLYGPGPTTAMFSAIGVGG